MPDEKLNSELPPGPWGWEDNGPTSRPMGYGFVYLIDANGRKIGTFWGKPTEKVAMANFVCDAMEKAVKNA